jgi:hypothetical protein
MGFTAQWKQDVMVGDVQGKLSPRLNKTLKKHYLTLGVEG